jgi:osmotically-inducible protein OsmY
MYYSRLELRLLPRGWTGGQLLEGAINGGVRGAAIESGSWQVEYTLVQPRWGPKGHDLRTRSIGTARTVLPPDLVRLTAHTRVVAGGVPVGWVSCVWCDRSSRQVTHLLVQNRHALLFRAVERVVDVQQIAQLSDGRVTLKTTVSGFLALPAHRSDAAILSDLRLAFESALPDPHARRAVKLRVDDAQVTLSGEVDTSEQRQSAARAAASIAGVRGVINDVVITETVATAVDAALLAAFPDGRAAGVRVFSEHGIVYLEGRVTSVADRVKLEQVAVSVPGVRVVVNNVLAEGDSPERGRETGPLTRFR